MHGNEAKMAEVAAEALATSRSMSAVIAARDVPRKDVSAVGLRRLERLWGGVVTSDDSWVGRP